MKKILIILASVSILAACKKNDNYESLSNGALLTATIEDVSATKTYLDADNNIRWSEGDQVIAFMKSSLGLKYQVLPSGVGETSASFEEVPTSGGGLNAGTEWNDNIVYYPYASSIKAEKSGGSYILSVNLPEEQTYTSCSFSNGAMAMVAVSANNNITFRNVSGGMKLLLKGSQSIGSIKVEGKNNEKLSGAAKVTAYTDETKPTIIMSDNASTSVTLNCGNGVQLNESTATEFILAMPPTTFTKGFLVTVTDSEGSIQTIESDKYNEVKRSFLLVMPEVTLQPSEPGYKEGDYVDEYGINHGQGLDNGKWAPVNCGYKAPVVDEAGNVIDKGYPTGKSYQYGRRWGFGVSEKDASIAEKSAVPVTLDIAQSESYSNTILTDYEYIIGLYEDLWNLGTEAEPIKSEYDPCPNGWRVPTYSELDIFTRVNVSWWRNYDKDTKGFKYSFNDGTTIYADRAYRTSRASYVLRGWYLDYVQMDGKTFGKKATVGIRCIRDERGLIPVSEVSFAMESLELHIGDTYSFEVNISPSNANHQHAYWYSDDSSVISFDKNGLAFAVAEGTTTVNAIVGLKTARCQVTVKRREPASDGYIDEYGINHGAGIEIEGTIWAPVNCGYHKDDFKFGKLYQWGRKYGQGYEGDLHGGKYTTYSDARTPSIESGAVSVDVGNSEQKSDVIFSSTYNDKYDWVTPQDDKLWNSGSEINPIKTEYDPCPDGWRVPTRPELETLLESGSSLSKNVSGFISYYSSGTYARGYKGGYWSSGTNGGSAYYMIYDSMFDEHSLSSTYRTDGYSIRCVKYVDPVLSVSMDIRSTELFLGESAYINATIVPSSYSASWSSDAPDVVSVNQNGMITALSVGVAKIKAEAKGVYDECTVMVYSAVPSIEYIDEYGVNHGKGIAIGDAIWAPVNCGYHVQNHPYGKLYQWGRKYGQGYDTTYAESSPEIKEGPVPSDEAQLIENSQVFYIVWNSPYDWAEVQNDQLWNTGTESEPQKSIYDPCPEGWRVPTTKELSNLNLNKSEWAVNDKAQNGYWFSGPYTYSESVPQLFLPAAGFLSGTDGYARYRGSSGRYWASSPKDTNGGFLYLGNKYTSYTWRSEGNSVRCVEE